MDRLKKSEANMFSIKASFPKVFFWIIFVTISLTAVMVIRNERDYFAFINDLQSNELFDLPSKYIDLNTTQKSNEVSYMSHHRFMEPNPFDYNETIYHFVKQDGVAIATKIHGPHQFSLLTQSLCLLQSAYNSRFNYDIIVFTVEPLSKKEIEEVQSLVSPAKLTVVIDNRGLQEEIAALSPIRRKLLLERCNVTNPVDITWWSECPGRLAYNWQAEFRSWHIWRHPSLADYRYMLWIDSDGFSTEIWKQDPVEYMVSHDLVMLFDNFPQGRTQGKALHPIHERAQKTFNTTLCNLRITDDGLFKSRLGHYDDCKSFSIPLIHGFFHITNLDFYRSDLMTEWAKNFIGDCFLCREFDDQYVW
jgi:hypothetical protein